MASPSSNHASGAKGTTAAQPPPAPPAAVAALRKENAPRLTRQLTSTMDDFDDADQSEIAAMKSRWDRRHGGRGAKELAAKRQNQRAAVRSKPDFSSALPRISAEGT